MAFPGEPLPPVEVEWEAGTGEVAEVRARVDALAELIQVHKNMKQPTCETRRAGMRSNATVHFESP